MRVLTGLSPAREYNLETIPFAKGGEGIIYKIKNEKNIVAKIYSRKFLKTDIEKKLLYMFDKTPKKSLVKQVAWPVDILYKNGKFRGFIMDKFNITHNLEKIYEYPSRENISIKTKIKVAKGICKLIKELHKLNYIFGDFSSRNIGYNIDSSTVFFLDTDSFHIINKKKNIEFRCTVGSPGYVAPELLLKVSNENLVADVYELASLDTFTQYTDNFALAIHIFKLMMNGYTPFNGIKKTDSVSDSMVKPGVGDEAVKLDNYCFKPGNKPFTFAVLRKKDLPRFILKLFNRAFIDGRKDPAKRPDAGEWLSALTKYEKHLKQCKNKKNHQFYKKLFRFQCPWCLADDRFKMQNNVKKQVIVNLP
jgi:DNA-binding helix-hairpin-helix protein with protein kinase domain